MVVMPRNIPVSRASSKNRLKVENLSVRQHQGGLLPVAANTKARQALTTFASNSRHSSPWAAKLYTDARRRGKHHPHPSASWPRAWLRVMWACWHNDTIYDPARHGAERRLAARTCLRKLKRRLSDAVYRQLLTDQHQPAQVQP